MDVSSATGTADATGALTSSATGLNTVDFNTFLKLLVAQLKNQDPLNPLDGTEFTGQIAQFSALEQQINSNNYLSKLVEQRDYGQQTLAVSYLNKVVLAPGDTVALGEEGGTEFAYSLGKDAARVDISIYDGEGNLVRTVNGDKSAGNHIVTWDGLDDEGNDLEAGNYTVNVKAYDSKDVVIPNTTMTYGVVASVLNSDGAANLIMADGRNVALEDVLAVTSL